tara:strand:- start:5649 stop:5888 length:240 start_codon:yes stop_codon:yes gene_type:complete
MPALLEPNRQIERASRTTLRIAKHFPFFLAVAQEQNLHRAAERLNIAQSALHGAFRNLSANFAMKPWSDGLCYRPFFSV